jgi:hypothetical protein
MRTSSFLRSSVAATVIAGAFSLDGPAYAQQQPGYEQGYAQQQPATQPTQPNSSQDGGLYGSQVNPPQYSTPAEKQETRSLNDQSVDGTTASPAVLNGQTPASNNAVQTQSPQNDNLPQSDQPNPQQSGPQSSNADLMHVAQYNPQPGGAQQEYDAQQQQYQQQQEQYESQQQQYQDQKHDYYRNLRQYDQAQWAYDYPAAITYEYEGPHLQRLYLIAEPSQQLANVPIEGPNGMWVGRVRNVEIAPDGRPLRVEIALNRRVSVWVDPGNFRFDPSERILFTNLSRDDLWNMPGATVESAPM